jgi:putative FmdB family regulatory protein
MPTYSYHCDTNDHDFDIVQRFADDALTVCPECGGSVRRVIQPVGVVFKGSGWYINDSRKSSSSEGGASGARGKSSEKSESTGEKSSGEKGSSEKSSADKGSSEKPSGEKSTATAEKATAKAAD